MTGWFSEQQGRGRSAGWSDHVTQRVRIVETWKWDAHHLTLRFDSGDTLIVGGLLLVDPRALTRMVADRLDATLTLPKRVRNGRALGSYMLSLRRSAASKRQTQPRSCNVSGVGQKGPWESITAVCGLGIAGLLRTLRVRFSK